VISTRPVSRPQLRDCASGRLRVAERGCGSRHVQRQLPPSQGLGALRHAVPLRSRSGCRV